MPYVEKSLGTLDPLFSRSSNFQDTLTIPLVPREQWKSQPWQITSAAVLLLLQRKALFRSFSDIWSTPGHLRILFLLAVSTARREMDIIFLSPCRLTQSALRSIWMLDGSAGRQIEVIHLTRCEGSGAVAVKFSLSGPLSDRAWSAGKWERQLVQAKLKIKAHRRGLLVFARCVNIKW